MMDRYDDIAQYYDLIVQKGYYHYPEASNSIHSIIKGRKKILEIGVGTGLLAEKLLTIDPNYELTGIDITPSMLEIAKGRLGGRVKLLEGDVVSMDLPESFDVVYSNGGPIGFAKVGDDYHLGCFISNLEDNAKALQNIADCLVNHGLLVLNIERDRMVDAEKTIENGIVFTQTVKESLVEGKELYFIDKNYLVKQGDRILARAQCKFLRIYGEILENMLAKANFRFKEDISNELYLVYQKVV